MSRLVGFTILYEDPHLIAVSKPAPLLTQAPPGVPSLEAMVKAYLKEKHAKPAGVYLGIPHRLDRPVSGVVVFARNTKAAQRVHLQFHERRVQKTYWAIVDGDVQPDAGTWNDWLRKIPEESRTVPAAEGEPGAKPATLEYRVLGRNVFREPFPLTPGPSPTEGEGSQTNTLLELRPRTGRMHQLRVQCALRGHPVRGDAAYGSPAPFGPPADLPRDRVIALHARRLVIEHPFTKGELAFVANVPSYWGLSDPLPG